VTFSDKRVIEVINQSFVPVWESVAPVAVAVFDLGDGKTVRGTMGGEIAIYFCRPDGKVFDILPALHSPAATLAAIKAALAFYQSTGATDDAIRKHHLDELVSMVATGKGKPTAQTARAKKDQHMKDGADPATKAMGKMMYSKSGVSEPEPIVVVEPGGLDLFKKQVHQAMASGAPRTPREWTKQLFITIMDQPLDQGGEHIYDIDTLKPISLDE